MAYHTLEWQRSLVEPLAAYLVFLSSRRCARSVTEPEVDTARF